MIPLFYQCVCVRDPCLLPPAAVTLHLPFGFLLLYLCGVWGILDLLRYNSLLCSQKSLPFGLEDHMGCQKLNLGKLLARKMPFLQFTEALLSASLCFTYSGYFLTYLYSSKVQVFKPPYFDAFAIYFQTLIKMAK